MIVYGVILLIMILTDILSGGTGEIYKYFDFDIVKVSWAALVVQLWFLTKAVKGSKK